MKQARSPAAGACGLRAGQAYEPALLVFLQRRTGNRHAAEDLRQKVFLKSVRQGQMCCELRNLRAWLFQFARHVLMDSARRPGRWRNSPILRPRCTAMNALRATLWRDGSKETWLNWTPTAEPSSSPAICRDKHLAPMPKPVGSPGPLPNRAGHGRGNDSAIKQWRTAESASTRRDRSAAIFHAAMTESFFRDARLLE